jgi:hypothetical protein
MRLPSSTTALVLLIGALALGACGGSDDDAATSGPGPNGNDGGNNGADGSNATDGGDVADGSIPPPPAPTCDAPEAAADTSAPTTVVGTGDPATCTQDALTAAVATGGVITFDCGAAPATVAITKTLTLRTDVDTVIDGGGKVTLDGGSAVSIMRFEHPDFRVNDKKLTLQHLTLAHGKIAGTKPYDTSAPPPCSQGFYDGYGGALYMRDGVLLVVDVTFLDNAAEKLGPDVGGGAISILGVKKATVIGSIFKGNTGSNGGAIESLNSELDVYNSTFDTNAALGNGANSDDAGQCSVVADTNQHQVGSGGNGGAVAIDGGSDGTHTFCGVRFVGNKAGVKALGGAIGRTPDGAKQTTIFDRCLFEANTADSGGAAYFHNSTLQILASTFHANKAASIGAIQADGTTFDFANDTFVENEATGADSVGGVLALFGGDGKIESSTFANNKAGGFGAAIFGNPTLTIHNTLFSNDTGQNPGAPMQCQVTATGDGDLQFPRNHVSGSAPDAECVAGITFADPMLDALGDNGGPTPTAAPKAGSPAVGAGKTCVPTDQRGKPRKADGCTSGAVELP